MRYSIRQRFVQLEGGMVAECLVKALADFLFETRRRTRYSSMLWNDAQRPFARLGVNGEWLVFAYVPNRVIENAAGRLSRRHGIELRIARARILGFASSLREHYWQEVPMAQVA